MPVMESPPGAEVILDGRRCLYFGGTGYFGLHSHPAVIRAGVRAFRKYGTHNATSRAGFGNNPVLLRVEARLREFFADEDAAYFGSGYLGSLILAQALAPEVDILFVDESAHFCINDAVPSPGKPVVRFRHRDPDDLARKLRLRLGGGQRPVLLTDGVFPVFGRVAPVPDYVRVLSRYGGVIAIDDAHGAGVLGKNGRGTYEHFGLKGPGLYRCGTLSKAFGGHGGYVVGKKTFIGRIRSSIGAYIGSTPTPTPVAAATAKGIEILLRHPQRRERLRRNVAVLKAGLKNLGIPVEDNPVPIAAWCLRTEKEMKGVQQKLMRQGIAVPRLKYAGAPASGVLRVTVFSTHTLGQIKRLLDALAKAL